MTSGAQPGAFFVAAKPSTRRGARQARRGPRASTSRAWRRGPRGDAIKLRKLRIALADQYGGSMPSGWTRWLLEQFEFPFEVVYPKALDAGNLASRFDVIIFPSGVGPARPVRRRRAAAAAAAAGGGRGGGAESEYPGRIPEPSSGLHGGPDGPAAEEVRRGRRHDPRGRPLGRSNLARADRPAGRQPPRRTLAGRHRAAAAVGEVLRAGLGPAHGGRQHVADRARHRQARSTSSSTTARSSGSSPRR